MPAVRNSVRLLATLAAAGVALAAAGCVAQEDAAPPRPEMRFIAPPFTQAPAEAGRGLYQQHCQSCHGPDLGGGSASRPLKGRSFYSHWSGGKTIRSLFTYLRTTMPPGMAGTIAPEDHANIAAYLLSENGIAAGTEPLPADENALLAYRLPFRGDSSGGLALETRLPPWPAAPDPAAKLGKVTDRLLAAPPPGDWPSWRRSVDGAGFSPLTQVDRSNVKQLQLAWSFDLPAGPNASTPLVHDGVMFVYANGDVITALDAANGTPLWTYRHPNRRPTGPVARVKRNIALYGDKLYFSTANNSDVALEARTGRLVWESPNGNGTSGGPLVIGGTVIQGTLRSGVPGSSPAGGARDIANGAATADCLTCGGGGGHVVAWNAEDGKLLWQTRLGGVPSGAPISFSAGGRQYIAVITGFGSLLSTGFLPLVPEIQVPDAAGSAVYVFALPDQS